MHFYFSFSFNYFSTSS